MPLPSELHMPSLDGLPVNQGTLMLNIALARGGPQDDILRRHFVNFVRLADLSVAEYERARVHLTDSLPGGDNRLGSLLSAIDHLELCVICVRRTMNALDSVVRHPESPEIRRIDRRAISAFENFLRPTRDAIVHIESDISKGDIAMGESHALMVSEDGRTASIGNNNLCLTSLGNAVRRLHELASELARYRKAEQP